MPWPSPASHRARLAAPRPGGDPRVASRGGLDRSLALFRRVPPPRRPAGRHGAGRVPVAARRAPRAVVEEADGHPSAVRGGRHRGRPDLRVVRREGAPRPAPRAARPRRRAADLAGGRHRAAHADARRVAHLRRPRRGRPRARVAAQRERRGRPSDGPRLHARHPGRLLRRARPPDRRRPRPRAARRGLGVHAPRRAPVRRNPAVASRRHLLRTTGPRHRRRRRPGPSRGPGRRPVPARADPLDPRGAGRARGGPDRPRAGLGRGPRARARSTTTATTSASRCSAAGRCPTGSSSTSSPRRSPTPP